MQGWSIVRILKKNKNILLFVWLLMLFYGFLCFLKKFFMSWEGGQEVEANMNEKRRRIDFSKISFSGNLLTTDQALRDVEPFDWGESVGGNVQRASIACPYPARDK